MEFSSSVLSYLASVMVRSLGLAVLALAAVLVFRIKAAAALHAISTLVVAGMLALAALAPVLPPIPLRVLRTEAVQAVDLPTAPLQMQTATGNPRPDRPVSTPDQWPTWQQVLVMVYVAGMFVFLIRLAFGYLFTLRLLRASRPIYQPWATEVHESGWISVPLTVGWLRPRILLPQGWEQWEGPKLQAVLAHEGTHVQRGDWAIALLARLNRCLFWFHPLAWFLERRVAFLAERACDDAALLQVGVEPYAQALLDMAAAVKTRQGRLVWEAMAMANVTEVRQRIERILDETREIPRGLTRFRWVALIACSLPLVYLASVVQLAPAQAQQQAGTPSALSELLKSKRQLSPGDLSLMEEYLKSNPQDLDVRTQLVLHYFSNGTREPRLSHILWMIANHPESTQTVFVSRGIGPRTTTLNDAADYARAAGLWKQQAAIHATDARVLDNAADFLSQPGGDFDGAERLLIAAAKIEPGDPMPLIKISKLYATAIIGSAGDPQFRELDSAFASRVKLQLENSTDGTLLRRTGMLLAGVGLRPQPGQKLAEGVINLDEHPMLIPVVEMGNRLIARSEQFLAGVAGIVGSVPTGQKPLMSNLRDQAIGSFSAPPLATSPQLISQVDPLYPPLAKQARISGDVELSVTIGTDGRVTAIQQVPNHGHPLLVGAAMEAVRQWVYAPVPSAGTIHVLVPFRLSGDQQVMGGVIGGKKGGVIGGVIDGVPGGVPGGVAQVPPPPPPPLPSGSDGAMLPPRRIKIGGTVQAANLISRVDPVYPPEARSEGIEGDVTLEVIIGEDGHVQTANPTDGHPVLAAAAAEAVKQWIYRPTLLNNQPISVASTVKVSFRLN